MSPKAAELFASWAMPTCASCSDFLKDYLESEAEEEHKALRVVCLFVLIIYSTCRSLAVDAWFDLIRDPMSVRLIMLSNSPLHEW